MGLLDLPTEILKEIVEHVPFVVEDRWHMESCIKRGEWPPKSARTTLRRLCRTCHTLRAVAQPLLFRSLTLVKDTQKAGTMFVKYTESITQCPELRKNAKMLNFYLGSESEFRGDREVWIPKRCDLSGLKQAAPDFFASGKKRSMWMSGRTIKVDPHVLLLVSLLPKLQVLNLNAKQQRGDTGIARIGDMYKNLMELKELVLVASYGDLTPSDSLAPLLRLPHLTRLELKNFDIAGFYHKKMESSYDDKSLNIEKLAIKRCSMTNVIMERLIRACRRLTHFEYRAYREFGDKNHPEKNIDIELWYAALSVHKDSLQEVCVNPVHEPEWAPERHSLRELQPWPSFHEFLHLKILKIEYRRMLLTHLPPTLTYLYLFDSRFSPRDAEIDGWQAIKKDFCPDIETVEIMFTEDCRSAQSTLKYRHFQWGCWTQKTREWRKGGFLLKVWFKDFIDGTYHFSQVSGRHDRDRHMR